MKLENKLRKIFAIGSAIAIPFIYAGLARAEQPEKVIKYKSEREYYSDQQKNPNANTGVKKVIEYESEADYFRDQQWKLHPGKSTMSNKEKRAYEAEQKAKRESEKKKELGTKIKELQEKIKKERKKEYLYELADTYNEFGNKKKAIDLLYIGIAAFENDAKMYNKLGHFIEGPEESLKYYQKASELDSNNGRAYGGIGYNLWLLGKKEEALKYFKKGTDLGNDESKLNYEWALNQLGKK